MIDRDAFNRLAIAWDLDTLKNSMPDRMPGRDAAFLGPLGDDVFRIAGIIADAFPLGTPRPRIMTAMGRLQFGWWNGPKRLELEISHDGMIRYMSWDGARGREAGGEVGIDDVETVRDLICWLVGGPAPDDLGIGP